MFALARTLRKSTKNPSEQASRASRTTDRSRNALFSSLQASKLSPRAPLSGLRGVWGASWALLGRSWGALGRSWASKFSCFFSKMYERTRNLLSWRLLGCSWESPGRSELDFGPSEGRFCPSSGRFGGLPIGKLHRQTRAKSWQNPGEVLAKTIANILSNPNE